MAMRRSVYREKAKTGVLGLGERTGVGGVANDPAAIGGDVLIGVEAIDRHKGVPGGSGQIGVYGDGQPGTGMVWFKRTRKDTFGTPRLPKLPVNVELGDVLMITTEAETGQG